MASNIPANPQFHFSGGSPIFQSIIPVSPADQNAQPLHLALAPGTAGSTIVESGLDSLNSGHLVDSEFVKKVHTDLKTMFKNPRFCPPPRFPGVPPACIPLQTDPKSFNAEKPVIDYSKPPLAGMFQFPTEEGELASKNVIDYLNKLQADPRYQANSDIAFLPLEVGVDQVLFDTKKPGDRLLMSYMKRDTVPTPQDSRCYDGVSMEGYLTAVLSKLLETKIQHSPEGPVPIFRYRGFVAPINWKWNLRDRESHAGLFYFGPVKRNQSSPELAAPCFFEPHPAEFDAATEQWSGLWEPFPVQVVGGLHMLGQERVHRFFAHQGDKGNCSEWMVAILNKLLLENHVPALDEFHQEILIPDGKPGTKTAAGQQLRVHMPDWMVKAM